MVSEGYSKGAPYDVRRDFSEFHSVYRTVARDCLSPEDELLAGLDNRQHTVQ